MNVHFVTFQTCIFVKRLNSLPFFSQGTAPTVSIDNTSGCQLYLSKDSLGASITSAKSSEINVMVPSGGTDGDWVRSAPHICTFGCIRKLNVVTNG